ncbi:unnamed protein product [Phytophthora fragariaefolia]|uniref:Unnamed protein product n=1 Tax=Phytophthora fragariaefolia TaxID=1490495 RepID=A0A9W6XWE5_9STRA|nr:unnamed protein product [Phytophthora fragariaefolia]
MVAASSTNAASGTPSGGGSAAPSVSSVPPARNDGRSFSDESEEEEVEWQPPGSKEVSPNSEAQDRAPSPSPKPWGPVSDNPPPDTEVGETTEPQIMRVDRSNALQTLGLLPSGRGSSSGMPVVVEIPPGEPSDLTVRVVGVPSPERQQRWEDLPLGWLRWSGGACPDGVLGGHGVGGPSAQEFHGEARAGQYPLPVRLQATGPADVWIGVASPEGGCQVRSDQAQASGSRWRRVGDRGSRRSPAAQARPAVPVQLLERKGGGSPEGEKRCHGADAFGLVLLMEERERDISSLRNQVQTLKGELETAWSSRKAPASRSQGPRLWTTHVMNFLQEHTTVMMSWPRLRDLLDHLESGTRDPPEWQTVITIMANATLACQAPPFVRMDPPQDEDDDETKESDPPAPGTFLDLSRGASTTKFRSKSSQLGKRASGSQSPKSNKKQAPGGVQELPSEWVGSTSPCRPEEVPLPLSPAQARASLADYSVVWKDLRRDVKLLMEDRLEYPAALALAGEDKCLHSSFLLDDLTVMLLSMMHWHRTPGPSLDDGEIDLLESEDEAEDKAEKDEDYNPHQDQDDGVDDEDEIPDDASDDGVLNVAQRATKRRWLSQSSAGVSTPKKIKTKSPVKTKIKVGRQASPIKGPQHLHSEECRVIESPGLGITSWMYFGVRMKPGGPTAHAPFQTQGFPDFVPNRHDLDILKERCDGEGLEAFLATRPWTKLSDTQRTQFFFHRRVDLGHEVVRALEDWDDFMEQRVEALWHATHWVVLDRDSTYKFIRKTSVRRLKLHESVQKKGIARENRSHTKPGTNANYSLKEQVELLDAREPARLQWGACSSDKERIDHLPEDVRCKLIPSGQRDYLDD